MEAIGFPTAAYPVVPLHVGGQKLRQGAYAEENEKQVDVNLQALGSAGGTSVVVSSD